MFVVLLHFYSARPTPAYGEIARALRARSHQVWIGQPTAEGQFVFLDESGEIERLVGPVGGRVRSLAFMRRLRQRLNALKPDVVQITPAPWSWVLACRSKSDAIFVNDIRTAGSGVGGGARAWLVDASAWLSWRVGASRWFDATTFLNDAGAKWLFGKHHGGSPVIPLGISERFLAPLPTRVARIGRLIRFVYLGTISMERNLARVLAAARLVARETENFQLTLLGPDDGAGGRRAVQQIITEYQLEHVIDLMAPVPYQQVPETLAEFDVALSYVPDTRVQRRQTFLKILECRAVGLPQITTRTEPNSAVVTDEVSGLLVEDSAESYAQAMLRLIGDPATLERLTAGAASGRHGISWSDVAQQYELLYQRCRERRR